MADPIKTEDWKRSHQEGVRMLKDAYEKDGMTPAAAHRKASHQQVSITNEAREDYDRK